MSLRLGLLSAAVCRRRPPVPRRYVSSLLQQTPATVISVPTQHALDEAELDVDILPPSQAVLNITTPAAQQLQLISNKNKDKDTALRIAVQSGGCHGYQYSLTVTSSPQPDD